MDPFDHSDYETPIGSYPGYIGHTWDGAPVFSSAYCDLGAFPWRDYADALEEREPLEQLHVTWRPTATGEPRTVVIELDDFRDSCDPAWIFDQLPTLAVLYDSGPEGGGPASGSGYVFFEESGTEREELLISLEALLAAMRMHLPVLASDET